MAPSDIPALFFVGEFDSVTPPVWARAAAAKYPNGYLIEIPNQSHVLRDTSTQKACIAGIVEAFLAHPDREPPASCIASPEPIRFLTPDNG